jgi:hypothetical protein
MLSPKKHLRSIAVFSMLSFLCLQAAQSLPLAARSEPEKSKAGAGAQSAVPGFAEQAGPDVRPAAKHSRLLPSLLGLVVAAAVAAVLVLTVFKKSGYSPHVIPEEFVKGISNPYFPLVTGQVRNYAISGQGDAATLSVTSTANSKMILGILCLGFHDRGIAAEGQTEDTWRWYAQDADGNVWYFASETKKYNYADLSEQSSWQAGTSGAKPGKAMVGRPQDFINKEFQVDFVPGVSEHKAQVLGVGETVTVASGTFSGCVKIRVYSDLESGKEEHQYYAPGVGLILSESVPAGGRRMELVSIGNE